MRRLAQEPRNAGFLTVKGRCRFEMNHLEESLQDDDKALAQSPSDFEAEMHKGCSLNRLMRSDEALAVFNRAVHSRPQPPALVYESHDPVRTGGQRAGPEGY